MESDASDGRAPSPQGKRTLSRNYMEKLHAAIALLVAKSNDMDVDDDDVLWARSRLRQYLEEVDELYADEILKGAANGRET